MALALSQFILQISEKINFSIQIRLALGYFPNTRVVVIEIGAGFENGDFPTSPYWSWLEMEITRLRKFPFGLVASVDVDPRVIVA